MNFCMKNGIKLRSKLVILEAFEDKIVEELGAKLVSSSKHCYTANHQTGELNRVQHTKWIA